MTERKGRAATLVDATVVAIRDHEQLAILRPLDLTPGTGIATWRDVEPHVPCDEVRVEVMGTPQVVVRTPGLPGEHPLLDMTHRIFRHLTHDFIPRLEPLART